MASRADETRSTIHVHQDAPWKVGYTIQYTNSMRPLLCPDTRRHKEWYSQTSIIRPFLIQNPWYPTVFCKKTDGSHCFLHALIRHSVSDTDSHFRAQPVTGTYTLLWSSDTVDTHVRKMYANSRLLFCSCTCSSKMLHFDIHMHMCIMRARACLEARIC